MGFVLALLSHVVIRLSFSSHFISRYHTSLVSRSVLALSVSLFPFIIVRITQQTL